MEHKFNKNDVASFGRYLLSKDRETRVRHFFSQCNEEEMKVRLSKVYQADYDKWLEQEESLEIHPMDEI